MFDTPTRKKAIELIKRCLDTIHDQIGGCTQGCMHIESLTPEFESESKQRILEQSPVGQFTGSSFNVQKGKNPRAHQNYLRKSYDSEDEDEEVYIKYHYKPKSKIYKLI